MARKHEAREDEKESLFYMPGPPRLVQSSNAASSRLDYRSTARGTESAFGGARRSLDLDADAGGYRLPHVA